MKFFLGITGIFMILSNVQAQEAAFSQYYSSELYLNPAMAGEERYVTFSSNFRQQWRSIVTPYTTTQLSAVVPIYQKSAKEKHKGGVGLSLLNDQAGDVKFRTTGVNITGAYNLPLTLDYKHNLSFGMQMGVIQKSVDLSRMEWGEQYNPNVGFDASLGNSEGQFGSTVWYPSISAGVMYYYNYQQEYNEREFSGYVGISTYHINEPNESLAKDGVSTLPRLYKAHGGINVPVGEKFYLSPNVLYMQQLKNHHINAGMYVYYELFGSTQNLFDEAELIIGSWYRLADSFIFSIGMHQRAWTFGFSYDYNNSGLQYVTRGRGAYELSLQLRLVKDRRIKRVATPRI